MTEGTSRQAIQDLVRELRAEESIVAETVQTILDTVPGYDDVARESLERSVRRNVTMSIRVIQGRLSPTTATIPEAEALATERLAQGVALGSLLAGFRVCMSVILKHLLELSPKYGLSASEALSFSTSLWALGDAFSARALSVYQERGIAAAAADSTRRMQWVIDAVVRGLSPLDLRRGAVVYDVPIDRPVRAFRLVDHADDGNDADDVVDRARRLGAHMVVAPHGGAAVGILTGELDREAVPARLTMALGPPVALNDLHDSYAAAARVLEAAGRAGLRGVVDLDRVSWRMGITASPETSEMLCDRLLTPLEDQGAFGELILEALSAYLKHGLNIPRAAASIPVHVNTMRYRLRRFEELTGADTQDLDSLFEVAWALAARSRS